MMTMSDLFCLVCDVNLAGSPCVNILYTSLSCTAEPLANFISCVLHMAISDFCGSHICSQCYNLFQMLEQAQRTVANIRCEILKIYRINERKKNTKQTSSNNVDSSTNFSTGVVFDESKRQVNTENEQLKEELDLDSIRIEEEIEERCIRDNVINQSLNGRNLDTDSSKIINNSKKNFRRKTDCDELNTIKSFHCNSANIEVKSNETLKDDIFNTSIVLADDNNVHRNATLEEKEVYCPQKCRLCDKVFKSTSEYNNHLSRHNDSQVYQCQKYKEKFSDINLANLDTLKMNVEDETMVSDSMKTKSKNYLKPNSILSENNMQMQNTTESINFTWKEVEKKAGQVKSNSENATETEIESLSIPLTSGKISKYNLKPLKYSCSTCGKKWKTTTELNMHVQSHSTLKPYMCEKCGQAYKHKHALEVHVGMHNGVNPFQCNFCKKCFTQKVALMRHLPMHTGETPYQCELCGKRFVHHTSYNMHRLSHSGKKSYKCPMCDLSLLSTSHLKRHMRVHTGEKPYSCSLCGKRFAQRYNLCVHQKTHNPSESKTKKTKDTQYKCSQCNLAFEKKENLDDHVQHHDAMNEESDLKKSCQAFQVESKTNEIGKKVDLDDTTLRQTLMEMNRTKLDAIDNQAKFVFLQNPLSDIDESSFAVTFSDHKMSLESTNYNTSLQVIIESSGGTVLSTNHLPIDKTHM